MSLLRKQELRLRSFLGLIFFELFDRYSYQGLLVDTLSLAGKHSSVSVRYRVRHKPLDHHLGKAGQRSPFTIFFRFRRNSECQRLDNFAA